MVGQSGDQPGRTRDVSGLRADRVAAAHDDVVDGSRVDAGAVDQRLQHVAAEVGRVHAGERAAALADRRTYGVDDVCGRKSHEVIPSRRMVRYWSATSWWLSLAPG